MHWSWFGWCYIDNCQTFYLSMSRVVYFYVRMVPGGDETILHILCSSILGGSSVSSIPVLIGRSISSIPVLIGRSISSIPMLILQQLMIWSLIIKKHIYHLSFLENVHQKKQISASVRSDQHPNAGQNIQHMIVLQNYLYGIV